MSEWAQFLSAIGTLLWPILAIVVLARFAPALKEIAESAKSRKFTLRVGGQELSMDEVGRQQRNLIADLQHQVLGLHRKFAGDDRIGGAQQVSTPSRRLPSGGILWVDDRPRNNGYFVQSLRDRGIKVDLALSTAEGLEKLSRRDYELVISDMGREEEGRYVPMAGFNLLREASASGSETPVVIYCGVRGAADHAQEADALGARLITASPTELAGAVDEFVATP